MQRLVMVVNAHFENQNVRFAFVGLFSALTGSAGPVWLEVQGRSKESQELHTGNYSPNSQSSRRTSLIGL